MARGVRRRDVLVGVAVAASASLTGCRRQRGGTSTSTTEPVEVDLDAVVGPFDRLSGVQGSSRPLFASDVDRVALFRDHHIEHARIDQDCPPNSLTLGGIFPDETADPDAPASYTFGEIDASIGAARAAGANVLWQAGYDVGRSDRWVGRNLGGRPPTDVARWTRVVTRCLEHFNHGWAGGTERAVADVEFLNEPDGLGGFTGQERPRLVPTFLAFLDAIAMHNRNHLDAPVRAVGPGLPFSLAEWSRFREPFAHALDRIAAEGKQLPVFSFHTYGHDVAPASNATLARELRALLDAHGHARTELWNTEWQAGDFMRRHLQLDPTTEARSTLDERRRYGAAMAAYALACKLRWQGVVQRSYYYRINQRAYPPGHSDPFVGEGSLLSGANRPGALALHELLTHRAFTAAPQRCATTYRDDDGLVTVQGLRSIAGDTCALLVSNLRTTQLSLDVRFVHAPTNKLHAATAETLDGRAALGTRTVAHQRDGDLVSLAVAVAPLSSELIVVR